VSKLDPEDGRTDYITLNNKRVNSKTVFKAILTWLHHNLLPCLRQALQDDPVEVTGDKTIFHERKRRHGVPYLEQSEK
jgi:hypothetical protein